MKNSIKFHPVFILLSLSFLLFLLSPAVYGDQAKPAAIEKQNLNTETRHAESGPKNTKEKVALYVFLVWTWISIVVCMYYFRQKAKEADRLHKYGFFNKTQIK